MTTITAGYREVLRGQVTGRLFAAGAISALGDFVGAGALLLLAYERSGGRAVGAAGFIAATAVGSLLVALVGAPGLRRIGHRTGLVGAELVGAFALGLPLLVPELWTTYVAAVVLGGTRSVGVSVRHAVLAEAVEERLRSGLLALFGTTDQVSQAVGFALGASLAVGIGAEVALGLDILTFVIGAVVLAGLHVEGSRPAPEDKPSMLAGWATLGAHVHLRLLAVLVLASTAATALPETLAAAAVGSESAWLPAVLAAGPAGAAIGYAVAGRLAATTRFGGQLTHLTLFAGATLVGGLADGAAAFVAVNVAIGIGSAWLVGPQVAFIRLVPTREVAQVMAVMMAILTLAEGGSVLALGLVADEIGVSWAYVVSGAVVSAAALLGWIVHAVRGPRRHAWDPDPGDLLPRETMTEAP